MRHYNPILSGIQLNLPCSEAEAWQMLDRLDVCANCIHFSRIDLFGGKCMPHAENSKTFMVGDSCKCECFIAADKAVDYWINKLVEAAHEYSGQNDFMRQLAFHENNGTANKFLGI